MNETEQAITWFEKRLSGTTMPGAREMFKVALLAIREKAEREKGCEYCNTPISTNDAGRKFFNATQNYFCTGQGEISLVQESSGDFYIHYECGDEPWPMCDVPAKICPMCGRRLAKEDANG